MNFEDYGLQKQLRDLWQEKKSGTLSCEVDGFEKQLFVKAGSICFATSNDPDDKLHMVLISQGRFSDEQFAEAEPNFNEDISVGRNLVEMGLISQQELVEGAKGQVYTVFKSLIGAANGTVEFKEALPDGIVSLPLNLPADFIRAILTINNKEWVSGQFGSLDFIPIINPEKPLNFDDLSAVDFGADIFGLLDGETSYSSLAFEADVDEFTLQKFLFAMQFLGYITIEMDESGDDEEEPAAPEPEVEDVRDDLSEALAQSEELDSLKHVSMDETIDLPAMKGLTEDGQVAMGSLDATMEISKDALKMDDAMDINAINPESTAEIEAAAAFEAMADEDDDDEEDDEDEDDVGLDDAMGMDTMGAFEPDDDEQGLDDLGAMSDAAMMDDMGDGSGEIGSSIPDDVIMPDDEDEDETSEAKPSRLAAIMGSRLVPLAAVGLILIGGLYMGRPYLEKHLNPLAPTDSVEATDIQAEVTPEEDTVQTKPPVVNDNKDSDKVEELPATSTVEDAAVPETAPVEDTVADADKSTDDTPAETVVETSSAVPTNPPTESSEEPKTQSSVAANEDPQDLEAAKLDPVTGLPIEQSLGGNANYSPVAEGWNSNSGMAPNGHRQAEVMIAKSPLREGALVARNTPKDVLPKEPNPKKPVSKEPAPKEETDDTRVVQLKEIKPNPTPTPEKAAKESAIKVPPSSKDVDDSVARQALSSGNFEQAARAFREAYAALGEQKTVMAYMVCNRENVKKAYLDAKDDPRFFVLPRGKCFWVCWGRFETRLEALNAKDALPTEMVNKMDNDIRLLRELF